MEQARLEINESLYYSNFCMRCIGVTLKEQKNKILYWAQKILFIFSVSSICYHVFGELVQVGITVATDPSVENIVPSFHLFGYGILSIAKVFVLWNKKEVCNELINELALDEVQATKDKKLDILRIAHKLYFFVNVTGLWFYNITPIGIYFYHVLRGEEAEVGYVWVSWYPFDKHTPVGHTVVYIFEMFAGQTCVWIVIGTDMLFSAMASHICLLLRVLQKRLESLASKDLTDDQNYQEILENVKLHQRLIRYCNDLEKIFTVSNLVNVVLSSVNICCVLFVIVLIEPFIAITNKMFLGSALVQIGVLCWYGDDILRANGDVAASAYNSGWYRTNPRCRRVLLFLLVRSQKPIAFTAMKFTNISLVTYTSILTRSYSYFTLLYTIYRG